MWPNNLSCRAQVAVWSACVSGLALLVFVTASGVVIRHEFQELVETSATSLASVTVLAVENGDADLNRWLLNHEDEQYKIAAVAREDGSLLFADDKLWSTDVAAILDAGGYAFAMDGFWRLRVYESDGYKVYIAVSLAEMEEEYLEFVVAYVLALPFALALAAWGGWWLGGKVARPIQAMSRAVSQVSPGDLGVRVPGTERLDEIGDLARLTNGMLERVEQGYVLARRFTGDASHELRTPLAILQSELEQRIHEADATGGDQESNGRMLDEIRRLKALTNSLLFLARADAGTLEIEDGSLNLAEALSEIVDEVGSEPFSETLAWEIECASDIRLRGEPNLLSQLLRNLLRNAALYNRKGGKVRCLVSSDSASVRIVIGNTGPTIPEESRALLFDRFYRCDKERSRQRDGFGLGLNISQAIAREHGGNLVLLPGGDDWTEFSITLPIG